jgi:hypothetical protein
MTTATTSKPKQPRDFHLGSIWRGPSGVRWKVIDEFPAAGATGYGEVVLRRLDRPAGTKGPNTLVRRTLVPLGWTLVRAAEG